MRDLQYYEKLGVFNKDQLFQIKMGLTESLDVSSYANPEFDSGQMFEIR